MVTGDGVLAFAVQKFTDFITREVNFLRGVKNEVAFIKRELIWMQSFLKDAEQKQGTDELIRLWLLEIRYISFKTEDIIDAYYAEVKGKEPSTKKLITTSLKKLSFTAGENNVYDIGKEIKALKTRLSEISAKREAYGIKNIGNATQETAHDQRLRDLRSTTYLPVEEKLVGFEDDINKLKSQLESSELRRSVVSIFGMGGLGKTSLARNLYNTKLYNTSNNRFMLHAWVCVSQQWNMKDLLEKIIKSFKKTTPEDRDMLEKMGDGELKRHLHDLLKDKPYLIVFDDMWHEASWDCLKDALPDNRNGSRIIITTRDKSVAQLSGGTTYVHELKGLGEKESWELFFNKVFPIIITRPDLEKIGEEMLAKCDGLPLAIIVLGGILLCKEPHEWHDIKKNIWKAVSDKNILISALLDLSYDELPSALKSCFLYLGIFPEDYKVRSEKAIYLWVAEGLIPPSEVSDLPEEVAERYIKELNARSLIQVSKNHYTQTSSFRIHDLIRDLAVKKAAEQHFFYIYGEIDNPSIQKFPTRRIAFRSQFNTYNQDIDGNSHPQAHTLSFLNYCNGYLDDGGVAELLTMINMKYKYLRVLDLEGVKIRTEEAKSQLFEAMGKLVHLRYLGLFETNINELPESIGNLQDLQVLDGLSGSSIDLPKGVSKLKQLRHLKGSFKISPTIPFSLFEELTNLQTLQNIDMIGWYGRNGLGKTVLVTVSKLCNLRTLSVRIADSQPIEPLFSCTTLTELTLTGAINNLPLEQLHVSLPNLRCLYLNRGRLWEDPLPALEKLPNLLVLCLSGLRMKSLIITATGFIKLENLKIRDFPRDMNLEIEEGALRSLKHIQIDKSNKFTLPERFNDLPK